MYKSSAPVFLQFMTALSGVLDKTAAFADAKKIDQGVLLQTRLYPNMFPLSVQVGQVVQHATRGCALLAGVEQPQFEAPETTIAGLKERLARAITFVQSVKPEQIDGTEDKEIVLKFPRGEMKFTGQQFLLNFTLPNFYFHATTAYNILRQIGVDIGKMDFMGAPPR
jgi:hypothetical protein